VDLTHSYEPGIPQWKVSAVNEIPVKEMIFTLLVIDVYEIVTQNPH
jgi:kynurenine formamidase